MLVLTRKEGETIRIGDDIEVVVRRIAGNRVTIAVAAPREVRILRGELEQFDDPPVRKRVGNPVPRNPPGSEREKYAIIQGRIPRSVTCSTSDAVVG